MTRVLVIGGAGYVGVPVVRRLSEVGLTPRVLDNHVYGRCTAAIDELANQQVDLLSGDLCDRDVLTRATRDIDVVVMLAGLVGDPIVRRYPAVASRINESGMRDATTFLASRVEQLIFVSTCSNYGLLPDDQLADETTDLNPVSDYARAKVGLESHLFGLDGRRASVTVLRFATAFGVAPRMRFDLTVNEFAKELSLGRELAVYDPDTWRPYCHVNDFAEIICRTIAKGASLDGEILNAGDNRNNHTKREIAELALRLIGRGSVQYVDKGSDPRNYRVSFDKVERLLDFSASRSIEDGLTDVSEFVARFVEAAGSAEELDSMGNYVIPE